MTERETLTLARRLYRSWLRRNAGRFGHPEIEKAADFFRRDLDNVRAEQRNPEAFARAKITAAARASTLESLLKIHKAA